VNEVTVTHRAAKLFYKGFDLKVLTGVVQQSVSYTYKSNEDFSGTL
jgi:hypothetical protein